MVIPITLFIQGDKIHTELKSFVTKDGAKYFVEDSMRTLQEEMVEKNKEENKS